MSSRKEMNEGRNREPTRIRLSSGHVRCIPSTMRKAHFINALMLCACLVVLTVGQEQETLKVLSEVNERSRPRLAKRLEEFIAYHRSKEWDKLFTLVDKENARRKTLESFSKEMSEFDRLDFVPERAMAEQPIGEEYRIYGCVTRKIGDVQELLQGGTVAYLQNGDWYFTPYFISYGSGTSPLPCKPRVK